MGRHLSISVIIPCGGHPKYQTRLRRCLESLSQQTVQPQQVIVIYMVDDSVVTQTASSLPLEPTTYFTGYSGLYPPALARNVGLRRAEGGVLVTLDADSLIHPETLRTCRRTIEKSSGRAVVRIQTSRLGFSADTANPPFQDAVKLDLFSPGPGGCIAAPRKVVRRIRGWDEAFVGYGAADWDYVTRLRQAGLEEVVFPQADAPRILVLHQIHKPSRMEEHTARARNRKLYDKTLEGGDPVRNDRSWGRS